MTIWKYPLSVTDEQDLVTPQWAVPLSVQVQNGIPCMWMLVEPSTTHVRRKVLIYGTGHKVGSHGQFVGTFQIAGGQLVFHVFMGEAGDN